MTDEQLLLKEIEKCYSYSELFNAAKYINMHYNIFLTDEQLWNEVRYAFGEKAYNYFTKYEKIIIANKFINLLLIKYYPSERTVKYSLVNTLKNKQDTVLFEMPVLGSRIDVCRINGNSYAYEIKTEFDSFKRLQKQLYDYSKVFEYIYIVIPRTFYYESQTLIPDFCGIRLYKHDSKNSNISFFTKKRAIKSPNLDPYSQLQCLSQENLYVCLNQYKMKDIPSQREERINLLINKYHPKTINTMFKKMIKHNYANNWRFLLKHFNEILPIDVQAFFNSPLDPALLYLKNP